MAGKSNTGLKGISAKLDSDGEPIGYNVSVQWKLEKRYAWIPASGYPELALEEAKTVRAIFEDELDKPRTECYIIGTAIGVTRVSRSNVWGGPVWMAYLEVDGKKHVTQFSIDKHGEEGAKKKALEWRDAKEAELWLED